MDVRFAVAVHVLVYLEKANGKTATSPILARSVNTHPTFIRQILRPLTEARLIQGERGRGGGVTLAKSAEQITLTDVWIAMDAPKKARVPIYPSSGTQCEVGSSFREIFQVCLDRAQEAFLNELGQVTLAQLAAEVSPTLSERRN